MYLYVPTLVILHLLVHTLALLQNIYSVGWDNNANVCVCVFPISIILYLLVHTLASLEEMYSVAFRELWNMFVQMLL